MYIKTINGAYEKPYSIGHLRKDNPQTSFPKNPTDALLAEWNVFPLTPTPRPSDDDTKNITEGTPVKQGDKWVQVWKVTPLTDDEIAARLKNLRDNIISQTISQTQQRLDEFAKSRGYDNILSACSYATSTVSKFAVEGQYCVEARDATWLKLYEILAEVESGIRELFSDYADIENELPEIIWPD